MPLLTAEGVLDVARLDALHHVVIEVEPTLGTSQLLPGQLIIPLALLDLSCGVLSVSFHDLNRRGRVHNPKYPTTAQVIEDRRSA